VMAPAKTLYPTQQKNLTPCFFLGMPPAKKSASDCKNI